MRKLIVIAAATFALYVQAQTGFSIAPNSNLIYSIDGNQSVSYLIPFIEAELKALKFPGLSQQAVFDTVANLNVYLNKNATSTKFMSAFRSLDRQGTDLNDNSKADEVSKQIAKIFFNWEYNLQININTLNSLIEYQFTLFRIVKADREKALGDIDLSSYRTVSVFIDPTAKDYKEKLRYSLKEIIKEANQPPTPVLIYEDKKVDSVFYVHANAPIVLTASQVDPDSPDETFKYHWDILEGGTKQLSLLDPNSKTQTLKLGIGFYYVLLNVNDGINSRIRRFVFFTQDYLPLIIDFLNNDLWDWDYQYKRLNVYSFFKRFDRYKSAPSGFMSSSIEEMLETSLKLSVIADSARFFFLQSAAQLSGSAETKVLIPVCSQNSNLPYCLEQVSLNDTTFKHYQLQINDGILTPSVLNFETESIRNSLITKDYFSISYHKLSRIIPAFDASYFFANADSIKTKIYSLTTGIEYLIMPQISMNPMAGVAMNIKNSNKTEYKAKFSYKVNLLIGMFTTQKVKLDLLFSFMNYPANSKKNPDKTYKVNSAGIGFQLKLLSGIFNYREIYSGTKLLFCYYSNNSSGIAAGMKGYQFTIRTSWPFETNK